jgi:hypothetical protein
MWQSLKAPQRPFKSGTGVLSLTKSFAGIGSVMMMENNELVKIYQLNENLNNELIGLQPGIILSFTEVNFKEDH